MVKKKYPIGIQNFERLRNEEYLYIDKTAIIQKLVTEGTYYFLSRPRRFGKSLLISTLQAYFEGKRELFKGLAIDTDEMDWQPRPVLKFDLNAEEYKSRESLATVLIRQMEPYEKRYGVDKIQPTLSGRFESLIKFAHEATGRTVAILVDEYDKPMLQAIESPELQAEYRSMLKAFYGVMKSSDEHIKFALLTGVTKFSKVSVFSDLNNIEDISFIDDYATLCGITEQEMRENLNEEISELAQKNKLTVEECYDKLRKWYDGYHFSSDLSLPGMYNPFSLINTLKNKAFKDYWFATGTPTFLVSTLKKTNYPLDELAKNPPVTADLLGELDSISKNPLPVLFQSGYLTIKDYDEEFESYTMGFPNYEVEFGFTKHLVETYNNKENNKSPFLVREFVRDIRNGSTEQWLQRLNAFLADGDYQIAGNEELYFQNVMSVIFKMLGFYVQTERHTSNGRMDIVMQTADYVYIIELKLDGSAKDALQQIEDKQYAAPFAMDGRTIIKVGANFSSKMRRIEEWLIE